MAVSSSSARGTHRSILALVLFLALCLGVSAVGGLITATSVGTWYATLQKPSFNPPNWLFAPVWTTLYVLMGIAAWRIWLRPGSQARRTALAVFAVQLGFNLLWSVLFFGLQAIGMALAEILLLLVLVTVNMLAFWRIDRPAGALFIPYVLWVGFAALLNASLWLLN